MKPRIGFLIPRLGISDRGAEVFVYELSKRLKDTFDLTIWARQSSRPTSLLIELVTLGIKIRMVRSISEDAQVVKFISSIPLVGLFLQKLHLSPHELEMCYFSFSSLPSLLRYKQDILFPNNGTWGMFVCFLVRLLRGTPVVYTSHGGREPLIAVQKPNLYVAIHKTTQDWLAEHYPNLNIVYIPNGVDLKRFSPWGKKVKLGLPHPIFVTAAALVEHKRIDLTIRAVAQLNKGSLLILGEGPLKKSLKSLAKKLLGKNRFLFQSVQNTKIPKYYRSADVFTLAAPWEIGIGLVQTEAMACGLPVVCNREPTIIQMIGSGGLVCDVTNVKEYTRTLEMAASTKFGATPRRQAQNYSWEKIAKIYTTYLLKVCQM